MKVPKLFTLTTAFCLLYGSQSEAKESFYYSNECNLHDYFMKNFEKYKASKDPPKSFQQQ